jgi:hypothetical protein
MHRLGKRSMKIVTQVDYPVRFAELTDTPDAAYPAQQLEAHIRRKGRHRHL